MKRRELRHEARQAAYVLMDVNMSNWPDSDLAIWFVVDDLTDDEILVLYDEFDKIKRRIFP